MDRNLVESRKITKEESEQCASERIDVIGSIQPHGFQLVVDPFTLEVVQHSGNFLSLLNTALEKKITINTPILNTHLSDWVWFQDEHLIDNLFHDRSIKVEIGARSVVSPDHWECLAHLSRGWVSLEFFPSNCEHFDSLHIISCMDSMIELLRGATSQEALFNVITSELQDYTQYDRVMMYRYLPDWSGEVVSECVSDREEIKYLGMRFPAEDIPKQARELYKKSKLRALADVSAEPTPLIPALLPDNEPLDQSYSLLRSVSEMHRIYLKNMGVHATLSISIKIDGELWGLLVFHHNDIRTPPNHVFNQLKQTCELFTEIISSYLQPTLHVDNLNHIMMVRKSIESIFMALKKENVSKWLFSEVLSSLYQVVDYDYVGVVLGSQCHVHCDGGAFALGEKTIEGIAGLFTSHDDLVFHSYKLHEDYGSIYGLEEMAGVYVVKSKVLNDFYAFFGRKAVVKDIVWGGEPETVNIVIKDGERKLEPRSSFARWRQTVEGQCEYWAEKDLTILEVMFEHFKDFISLKRNQILMDQLEKSAHCDALTGLPNRGYLRSFFTSKEVTNYSHITLIFIDIDNFKDVNDFMGHETGDRLLICIANRLNACVRRGDLVIRLGGDEFVVVLAHQEEPKRKSIASIAENIVKHIREPFLDQKHNVVVTASIGVVSEEVTEIDFDEVLKRADIAMYLAKNEGKNRFHFFDQDDQDSFNKKAILTMDLRKYIADQNIEVFYQAQSDYDKNIVGVEALARWNHPDFGYISPDVFIDIAEKNSLIVELGMNVINKVFYDFSVWISRGCLSEFSIVSINISPMQVAEPEFEQALYEALEYYNVPPENVCLEITESVFIKDYQESVDKLNRLREKGFIISLDDFGTGFSSLNSLWKLPIDEVKIDKTFIDNMCKDEDLFTMVESIISLCKKLKLRVVAEGVENNIVFNLLKGLGCDVCQGYVYCQPMNEREFKEKYISL